MKPWLVRLVLAVLALEAGVCVAFLADDWKPLREQENVFLERLLTTSRADDDFVIDNDVFDNNVIVDTRLHMKK